MQPQYQQPYPAQQYAPPMPQYPQQPPTPQYPAQPAYAPQPTYPQQYAPPAPPQAPQQPTAPGSLDAFYQQPSTGGGKAWSFHNKPNGTTYSGIVARPIVNSDVQQQTDKNTGAPKTYRDGRPMFVMIVPLLVTPSQDSPDGQAAWWVRGQARDELARAMAEAGAPEGPPEAGATVHVTKAGERPGRNGNNPSYQYRVQYIRPQGAAPVTAAPVVDQAPPAQPAPNYMAQATHPINQVMQAPATFVPGQPSVPYAASPTTGAYVPASPQPVQQAPAPVAPQTVPAPVAAAQPAQMPTGLNPDQEALFARLTGQQQAAPTA